MSCSGCGGGGHLKNEIIPPEPLKKTTSATVVEKTPDTAEKVRVRYYGGGQTSKKVASCATCGAAKGSYVRTTAETIMFASEDEPNGLYKQFVEAGRDYWVTKNQAEYLTSDEYSYISQTGEIAHKFKIID